MIYLEIGVDIIYRHVLLMVIVELVGERSEPPSDKIGGEIFISSCALVCLSCEYIIKYVRTA